MLGIPVRVGAYIDRSSSLHLYGYYFDRDGLGKQIERMRNTPYEQMSCSLDEFIENMNTSTNCIGLDGLKRLIAIQGDAEAKGHGLNLSEDKLMKLGYDTRTFPYPSDWDTWPKEWDAEPDVSKLARVVDVDEEIKRRLEIIRNSSKYCPAKKEALGRIGQMMDSSDHIMDEKFKV